MAFYELSKQERLKLTEKISADLLTDIQKNEVKKAKTYCSDEDTYIRKTAYLAIGRHYFSFQDIRDKILQLLEVLMQSDDFRVRQTAINAAGEIGKKDFDQVRHFFDTGLKDQHHSPRNAVIGSIKKMGEVNPGPVLAWAATYLKDPDKEIRREICHGIELRGRKHPADILPLLRTLEFDPTARVHNTLVHVLGQIAYKKGCLEIVVEDLKQWENRKLVEEALEEIIDVHDRYCNFSAKTQEQARAYIERHAH
jgi:HEAT repeat protein